MLHGIVNFVPNIARSIIQYRIDRLDVAMQYANDTGYAGARFAWETAATGFDVNPSNDSRIEDHVTPSQPFVRSSSESETKRKKHDNDSAMS